MAWKPCRNGGHNWKPWGARARYKCSLCEARGHKKRVRSASHGTERGDSGGLGLVFEKHGAAIVPYVCPVQRRGCGGPTKSPDRLCPNCLAETVKGGATKSGDIFSRVERRTSRGE
jgi:hypothetical protein